MAFLGIDPWLYLAAGQINLIYQYWDTETKNSPSGFLPIPEIDHKTFQKYNPEISSGARLYVIVWFIIILLLGFGFIVFNSKMSWEPKIISSIWIVLSLVSVNGILENKS
jgi:hypothetical protein